MNRNKSDWLKEGGGGGGGGGGARGAALVLNVLNSFKKSPKNQECTV